MHRCCDCNFALQAGTLRTGDIVACGATYGKVRSLNNSAGRPVSEAGPSIAVQLIGLNAVPQAGDEFQVGCRARMAATLIIYVQARLLLPLLSVSF
jgi:translation initiation factor IF-2